MDSEYQIYIIGTYRISEEIFKGSCFNLKDVDPKVFNTILLPFVLRKYGIYEKNVSQKEIYRYAKIFTTSKDPIYKWFTVDEVKEIRNELDKAIENATESRDVCIWNFISESDRNFLELDLDKTMQVLKTKDLKEYLTDKTFGLTWQKANEKRVGYYDTDYFDKYEYFFRESLKEVIAEIRENIMTDLSKEDVDQHEVDEIIEIVN